jgi:ABC-2 type transport system ATP-binding protein
LEIEARNISKLFGSTQAVDDISFSVESGARLALIGPNGSGKTTLIRLVLGLMKGDGELEVADTDPFENREQLAQRTAYVPQIAPETAMPVSQFVETVCRARSIEVASVYTITDRLHFDAREHATKPYQDLSGGMKQKLLIATALASEPELLVMDEPTASLDADARQVFFELCAQLPRSSSLILCSHRLEEIRHLIDEIVALEDGSVVDKGPVEVFVSNQGRVAIEFEIEDSISPSDEWLRQHDFEAVSDRRYVAFFPRSQKMDKLEALHTEFGDGLSDLIVNDLQDLQVDQSANPKDGESKR